MVAAKTVKAGMMNRADALVGFTIIKVVGRVSVRLKKVGEGARKNSKKSRNRLLAIPVGTT